MNQFSDERRRRQLLQSVAWAEQKLSEPGLDVETRQKLVREIAEARRTLRRLSDQRRR